ncbi:hypothetical protein RhiirA4_538537 [Rhizophagus irregularis]|uniref:Uncharacterized protein n=1 Tax=Rhizophagus irregularis TaxID=588596 RepID=A0A2I1G067_9GLOM|nr:hypothetical protein RhiirA4_538537 [Rhizophagus irregularis]
MLHQLVSVVYLEGFEQLVELDDFRDAVTSCFCDFSDEEKVVTRGFCCDDNDVIIIKGYCRDDDNDEDVVVARGLCCNNDVKRFLPR